MKKSEIEELEEIKKITKLSSEARNNIRKIFFDNIIISADILLFFVSLIILPYLIQNSISVLICKTADMLLLIFSIFLFEKAYKEDDGALAINGIEMLAMAIFTLFTPYGFIRWNNIFLKLTGVYFTIYYIGKSIVLSMQEKKKFMANLSDIKEIVKKESKDNLKDKMLEKERKAAEEKTKKKTTKKSKKAKEEKPEKKKEEDKKKIETKKTQTKKETSTTKKPTTSKATTKKKTVDGKTTEKPATTKKTTAKKEEEKPVETPKRGRGRPRKEPVEK